MSLLRKLTSCYIRRLAMVPNSKSVQPIQQARFMSSKSEETDAEFDARYEAYFNRPDIDGWEVRKAMSDLSGMDLVPEPAIVAAALRACRRLNDYALATRILEVVKLKCAPNVEELYPYMMQELKPTMEELGILSLEEMGYDMPELGMPSPFEVHGEDPPYEGGPPRRV